MSALHIDDVGYGAPLAPDVCVIGAGAAGLELATALHRSGHDVIVLEGGLASFDASHQRLHGHVNLGRRIRTPDPGRALTFEHACDRQPRLRQLGGTMNAWSGKWKLLDRVDVERGGWPIAYDELLRWCRAVAEDHGAASLFDPLPGGLGIAGRAGIVPSVHVKVEPPLRLHEGLHDDLRILLGANVVHLETAAGSTSLAAVVVRSLASRERRIEASRFVLACGTVENARLLLHASLADAERVGRNLLDHPKATCATLVVRGRVRVPESSYLPDGRRVGLALAPELLTEQGLPNHLVQLASERDGGHRVRFFLEQLPNPDSRVTLTGARDALGLPVVGLDWRLSSADVAGFRAFVASFSEQLASAGVGDLHVDDDAWDLGVFRDASHQLGTTPMSVHPQGGVVDPELRVHGLDNLYVTGSSVFPTAGHANPTLTILALARRLADRLARG